MRLIDADALIERIKYSFYDDNIVSICTVTETFLDEICSPTIDAMSVLHGAWFGVSARELFGSDSDQLAGYVCSECGFDIEECNADAFNYCPNCEAEKVEARESKESKAVSDEE